MDRSTGTVPVGQQICNSFRGDIMRVLGKAAMVAGLMAASSAAMAQSGVATVESTMSTYLAGGNSYTIPPACGIPGCAIPGGISPFAITLGAGVGRILTFSTITGSMTFCPGGSCASPTPDGWTAQPTDLNASGSISGIRGPTAGFLAGVFLGSGLPSSPPATLNFNTLTTNFSSLMPELGQQFFIGDGRTASNVIQQFLVPDGATTLYLGVADGALFGGNPGFYDDNTGAYSAAYSISTTVPEPSTVALLGVGLCVLLAGVRRRRQV